MLRIRDILVRIRIRGSKGLEYFVMLQDFRQNRK
jgi:hypothetical protein